jgi:hypothetical protein
VDAADLIRFFRTTGAIDMANELRADYASGHTIYAVIRDNAGGVWCPARRAFETWGADHYALPLADKGGSRYVGDFDANVPPGSYGIQLFAQTGASPAGGDVLIAGRDIYWTGNGELTSLKILANKAVHSKDPKSIEYYDDDSETTLFKHNMDPDGSGLTRTIG